MSPRRGVVVLYNLPQPPGETAPPQWQEADAGVLKEVEAVERALAALKIPHRVAGVRCLRDVPEALAVGTEPIVFNLVESLEGEAADACFVPAVCWSLRRRCTGNDTACQTICLNKWQNKAALQAHGVPVPQGLIVPIGRTPQISECPAGRLIVKPVATDASEGIDALSVIEPGDSGRLDAAVRRVHQQTHQPALIEQYIEGRELNVALLEKGDRVEVLPLAEIDFLSFPPEKPRIVDYAAKWLEHTFEYQHTVRRIPAPLPEPLADEVRQIARAAWTAVGCHGYARVDIRLDSNNRPFVLEINPNPDLSPDAGFSAALAAAGIRFEEFVATVLETARGVPKASRPRSSPPAETSSFPLSVAIRPSAPSDRDSIIQMAVATGFFRPDEIEVAKEVLDESLAQGRAFPYQSYTAEAGGRIVGWLAFGPTPCTLGTYDIYWIVVAPDVQRRGIGSALLKHAEKIIQERGGRLIVVDTSTRPIYTSTRRFYARHGYHEEARIKDLYAPGDDKVISVKRL